MIELTMFKCEKCGKLYEKKEDAEKCEKQQAGISGIKSTKYRGMGFGGDVTEPYPYVIIVTMDDGKDVRYDRYDSDRRFA